MTETIKEAPAMTQQPIKKRQRCVNPPHHLFRDVHITNIWIKKGKYE